MKTFRTSILLFCLLGFAQIETKTYKGGIIEPDVFDVCILLDSLKYQSNKNNLYYSQEERDVEVAISKKINLEKNLPPITKELVNIIHEEEAAIVATPIMRNIFRCAKLPAQDGKLRRAAE